MKRNVVSLETAKRLKAVGFKQETEFTWYCDEERDDTPVLNWTDLSRVVGGVGFTDAKYAAPTAQEIVNGELETRGVLVSCLQTTRWVAKLDDGTKAFGDTIAEALAALWLTLNNGGTDGRTEK